MLHQHIKGGDVMGFVYINPYDLVRVKKTGFVTEIMYQDKTNRRPTIIKLDKENYIICSTGEICTVKHSATRKGNVMEVKRSMNRLRDYINTNVIEPSHCKWVTLTYAENMTDTVQLKADIKRFMRKSRTFFGDFEYIICCEPQGRGAWHAHIIIIFSGVAPYMSNSDVANAWDKKGFVNVRRMKDSDNPGAYLTAYLGDMEMTDALEKKIDFEGLEVKSVQGKNYIKGARLGLYPTGFNLYRISRGIKKPSISRCKYSDAKIIVSDDVMTYSKNLEIEFNGIDKKMRYEYYNNIRGVEKKPCK